MTKQARNPDDYFWTIRASDAGAIMGVDPWRDPVDVYDEMRERHSYWLRYAKPPYRQSSVSAWVGECMEKPMLDHFCGELHNKHEGRVARVLQPGIHNENYKWLRARADMTLAISDESYEDASRMVRELNPMMATEPDGPGARVVEVKVLSDRLRDEWKDGVPARYLAQAQTYMGLGGYKLCTFYVLFGNSERCEFHVPFDEDQFEEIVEEMLRFRQDCVDEVEPTTPEWQERAHRRQNDESEVDLDQREPTPLIYERLSKLQATRLSIKRLESSLSEQMDALKQLTGKAQRLMWRGKEIAKWQTISRKEFTVEAKEITSFRVKPTMVMDKIINKSLDSDVREACRDDTPASEEQSSGS